MTSSPQSRTGYRHAAAGSTLGFQVSVLESERSLRLVCSFRNDSSEPIFLQNQYGNPYDFRMGEVGGGRSPNDPLRTASRFSTAPACMWPESNDTLLVFQGEVSCPIRPYDRRWPSPGYSRLPLGESSHEIRSVLPMRQWENNFPKGGAGPRLSIRRIHVCIDLLLGPMAVEEIDGVYACDFGQPAYVEAVVELARPVQFITDSVHAKRAEEKRAELRSCVRLGGPIDLPVPLAIAK